MSGTLLNHPPSGDIHFDVMVWGDSVNKTNPNFAELQNILSSYHQNYAVKLSAIHGVSCVEVHSYAATSWFCGRPCFYSGARSTHLSGSLLTGLQNISSRQTQYAPVSQSFIFSDMDFSIMILSVNML